MFLTESFPPWITKTKNNGDGVPRPSPQAQNAQCQSLRDSKEFRWPQYTREAGEWKKQTVRLLTGQNVLQWKTLGMDHGQSRPVLIKSIEISGQCEPT